MTIYKQDFENSQTAPMQLVNTDSQSLGGDGVYAVTAWGLPYSDRQVYIDSSVTYSGTRSLKHVVRPGGVLAALGSTEYTNCESTISPSDWTNPTEGTEVWSRMMMYVPPDFSWRNRNGGTIAEPKLFRTFYRSNYWSDSYFQVEKRYTDTWNPHSNALGLRFEREGPGSLREVTPGVPGPSSTSSIITYKAPSDNNYEAFKMPFGQWFSLEIYVKFSTTGIVRAWLNEVLLYEFALDTLYSQNRNAPHNRAQIQTLSTWGTLPDTGGVFYTDSYMMTDDPSQATKTDSRGNKMLGRPDVKGPVITDKVAVTKPTTATVSWTTDENSNSNVDYGTTDAYGTSAVGNTDTQEHVVVITGLTEGTTYNYRVRSADAAGNESVSDNATFKTLIEVSLNDLTDVALATPVEGQVMMYRGGEWVNVDPRPLVTQLVEELLSETSLVINKKPV